MTISSILRDPLTHFLIVGVIVFWVLGAPESTEEHNELVLDRDILLQFMQFRAKAFDPEKTQQIFEQMSYPELTKLIKEFKTDESLYREALNLGLDQGDYVIRLRLIGKMHYLTDSQITEKSASDEELMAFFETNKDEYSIAQTVTFTHVFLSNSKRSVNELERDANSLLRQLNSQKVGFTDAKNYGERFLYNDQYIERSKIFVATELGTAIAEKIFSTNTQLNTWLDPLLSEHGGHLILITNRKSARKVDFEEVQEQVKSDWVLGKRKEIKASLEASLVETYEFNTDPALQRWLNIKAQQYNEL